MIRAFNYMCSITYRIKNLNAQILYTLKLFPLMPLVDIHINCHTDILKSDISYI